MYRDDKTGETWGSTLPHHLFHHSQSEMAERAAAIHTMAAARRQRGCLQAPASPPLPRSRNYFPIRRNYRRGQFTCRLPFEHSAPRPPPRRRRNRGRRHWMDVGFSKSGKRDRARRTRASGVAGRRRKRFPVVLVAPTERETEGGDCRTWK